MDKINLDSIYDNLVEVLMQEIVFYIPREIIPSEIVEQVNNYIDDDLFNDILVLDTKNGFLIYEMEEFNPRLVNKHTELEKNIFQLLKLKKEIDGNEFNYILEKYADQLEFYCFVTNWLSTYFIQYNEKQTNYNNIIGTFGFQSGYYWTHFEELIIAFYPSLNEIPIRNFQLKELIEKYFPEAIARYSSAGKKHSSDLNEATTEHINEEQVLKHVEKNPLKKKQLIEEKASDDFILETVFKIIPK